MDHRKRILHLIDTSGPGGAETVFQMLVEGLPAGKWTSTAVVSREDWLTGALRKTGHEPLIIENRKAFDSSYVSRLVSLGRELQVDLIQAHLLGSGVYGTLAALFLRVPVVCTFHGAPDLRTGDRLGWLKAALLSRRKNRIVFVSEWLKDHFLDSMPLDPKRCSVIPNGVDLSRYRATRSPGLKEELGIPSDHILLGAVGNFRPSKAYDVLLKAFKEVRPRNPTTHLAIAGQEKEPLFSQLKSLRAALGLDSSVHFLGFREDTAHVFAGMDVFVLSSSDEGFSLSTVQAMASGLPVVATRCGGPETIVSDGVTGTLVARNDPADLARGIQDLLNMDDLGAGMGAEGRRKAARDISQAAMIASYESLYQKVLSNG